MTMRTSRPVAIGLRLYCAVARAFPQEFQNAYGQELIETAEEAIGTIWRTHGLLGFARLLLDIVVQVVAEYWAEFRQDVRYGLRTLAASPAFAAAAAISLSLAICAPMVFFSELNGTILRDVPAVAHPGELVSLSAPVSYSVYQRVGQRSDLFATSLAYVAPVPFGVSMGENRQRVWGHLVTLSYFSALGVRPALGRLFDDDADQRDMEPAVVISYRLWRERLGLDSSATGKTLLINGRLCRILGVAPKEFLGASPMFFEADLWLPLTAGARVAPELADGALERSDLRMFQVVARLRPGVTTARAERELDAYAAHTSGRTKLRLLLKTGGKVVPIRKRDLPLVFALPIVVVCLLLLIACSNVANMILARAVRRRKEVAIRLAMGAGRWRLVRQFLTESMLLAAAAGVLGFALAVWVTRLISRMEFPHAMPVRFQVEPDWQVLGFSILLTAFAGLAFGIAPALQVTRVDLAPSLKEGGDVPLHRFRAISLRNVMVLYQMAASLMLLLVTGTIVIGFLSTSGLELGFDPNGLSLVSFDPIRDGYSGGQAAALIRQVVDRVRADSAVSAVSVTEALPMAASGHVFFSSRSGSSNDARQPPTVESAAKYIVGTDYFDTLGMRIVLGRGFRRQDEANDSMHAIVNEKLVHELERRESAGPPH